MNLHESRSEIELHPRLPSGKKVNKISSNTFEPVKTLEEHLNEALTRCKELEELLKRELSMRQVLEEKQSKIETELQETKSQVKLLEEQLAEERATRYEIEERLKNELSIREELEQEKSKVELELQNIKTQVSYSVPSSHAKNDHSLFVELSQVWKQGEGTVPSRGNIIGKEEEVLSAQRMREIRKHIEYIRKHSEGNIYKLPRKLVMEDRKNRLAKYEIGNMGLDSGQGRVLMLFGAVGVGKSTLINGIVNYVYGVDYNDDFRFKLISDEDEVHKGHTKWITAYHLHMQRGFALSHALTVIDIDGFGDIEGIPADEELRDQIREFFTNGGYIGVDQLHAICFVVHSSLPRLTPTMTYIFHSILLVFGKDVIENIFLLITFAERNKPVVLDAIKGAKFPYKDYFKFNNTALFPDSTADGSDVVDKVLWKFNVTSFNIFFEKLLETQPVSLTLTKEVLHERRRLETALQSFQAQIIPSLRRLELLRQGNAALRQHEAELQTKVDFTSYEEVTKKKINTEGIVKELIKDFNKERANILDLTKRAHACLQRLDLIALKPFNWWVTDYIDFLIESEKREGREGFIQRLKYLQDTRDKAALAENLKHNFDPFKEYMKELEQEGFDISLFDPEPFED
ncbi:unnamed protein product [Darwinula stevensoni]|uniref:Uncharacterized protein n=1 Tax=Darwinula stevensoni TaxID=69355 RepID=A0A7R8X4M2_9CRUS|nr:unnamed protein product [Darwinula stevensoni]CAG0885295.1 unnamed protein product [Darwinula stevensoni]